MRYLGNSDIFKGMPQHVSHVTYRYSMTLGQYVYITNKSYNQICNDDMKLENSLRFSDMMLHRVVQMVNVHTKKQYLGQSSYTFVSGANISKI